MGKKQIIITALSLLILTGIYFTAANYGFFSGGTNAPSVPEDTMTRGLVGYWEFDEGTGQTAYDGSENGNNGTLGASASSASDDPKWGAGKNGGGMQFDGVDDYVDCGGDSSLDITDAITIEAWVKFSEQKDWGGLIAGRRVKAGDWLGFGYSINQRYEGQIEVVVSDGTDFDTISIQNISNDVWYHIVMTADGSTLRAYRDGVFVNSNDYTLTIQSGGITHIGGDWATHLFNGSIDSVRIYNRALDADEVRYHYNRGGPVGSWDFDEGSGTTAYDSTENNNDGTLKSSALEFDGANDYVSTADSASLDGVFGTETFTFEVWLNSTFEADYQGIINKRTSGYFSASPGGLFVNIDGNTLYFLIGTGNDSETIVSISTTLDHGSWTHFVGTADGTNMNLYKNGVLVGGPTAITKDPPTNDEPLTIGAFYAGVRTFNGDIDEVRIYNKALHATTVANHYNNDFTSYEKDVDEVDLVAANLVLLQHFEEGMACDANGEVDCLTDDSGSGNDGTLYSFDNLTVYDNGVDGWITDVKKPEWRWVNGKYKTAGEFNGVDDYVDAGNDDSLDITNAITISAWVNASAFGATEAVGIVSKTNWVSTLKGYTFYINSSGTLVFWTGDGSSSASAVSIYNLDIDTWYYVVGVHKSDSNEILVYINGVFAGSNTANYDIGINTTRLDIGLDFNDIDRFFNGSIDDVRIYDYARTADEIRLDYNAGVATHLGPSGKTCAEDPASCMDYGLVGSWGMDEGTGTIAYDASDNGNDGTLTNGPVWTTDSPPSQGGAGGGSLKFDGVDDYVDAGNDASLDITDAITIEAWFYRNGGNVRAYTEDWIGKRPWASVYMVSGTGSIRLYLSVDGVVDTTVSPTVPITNNIWTYLAFTYNSSTRTGKAYKNGDHYGTDVTLSGKSSYTIDSSPATPVKISHSSYTVNGSIDSVRIYNRALSAEEVRYHYNKGGPVAEWKFDEGSGTTIHDTSGNLHHGTLTP